MNKAEIAQLLTVIAVLDKRTIGDADVEAWHLILDDLPLEDSVQAVKDHYREETVWLMPAHVARRVEATIKARIAHEATEAFNAQVAADTAPTGKPLEGPPPPLEIGQRIPPATRGAGIGSGAHRTLDLSPGAKAAREELDRIRQERDSA